MRFYLLVFSLALVFSVRSQTIYTLNSPGISCYSHYSVYGEITAPKGVIVVLSHSPDRTPTTSFLQLDTALLQTYAVINIDLEELGSSTAMECIAFIIASHANINRYSKEGFVLLLPPEHPVFQSDSAKVVKHESGFSILSCSNSASEELKMRCDSITEHVVLKRPVPVKPVYVDKYDIRLANVTNNFSAGFGINSTIITGDRFGLNSPTLRDYRLVLSRNAGNRLAFTTYAGVMLKRPDTRSMQSAIQSKVQNAIENDEDTVFINAEMFGYMGFTAGLSMKYFYQKQGRLRFYTSLGYSTTSLTQIGGTIQDTMLVDELDELDMTSGGMGEPGSSGEMAEPYRLRSVVVQHGLEYKLGPPMKIELAFPVGWMFEAQQMASGRLTLGINFSVSLILNYKKVNE